MSALLPRPPGRLLLWGVPAATAFHNLEEALTIARYLPRVRHMAPESLRSAIPETRSVYVALAVATLFPIGFAMLTGSRRSSRWATSALFLVAAILLVNAAWHLGAAAALRGYAPGLATAVAVNLPLTLVVLRRASRTGSLSPRGLATLLFVAVLLHGPIALAAAALVLRIS